MPRDELWGNPVILSEVRDAFEEERRGAPDKKACVSIIIGVRWGAEPEQLVDTLQEMDISGQIRSTDRFVCAKVTEEQLEDIAKLEKLVFKIWANQCVHPTAEKTPASGECDESIKTIKADAALRLFDAHGSGVVWAVLDTGIRHTHGIFDADTVSQVYDEGFVEYDLNFTDEEPGDTNGHGTHIAGIIHQIAPRTKLYDVKVLGARGGEAFDVIQAMYTIRKINLLARHLVIHGVNLSLGGNVPVGSYGCGHSPQCQEANQLAESGVVVCAAAGNDGHKIIQALDADQTFQPFPTHMGLGVNDPGNAEKVITVGSVHKTAPHVYGVSYFSSKGPTGDGRFKPDVVAPGERIRSAVADDDQAYGEISGTSQATAEVSGVIAQFLSVKREFIGRADRVKEILMSSCTDLGRDRSFQGMGLVDVLRMIQSV